MCLSHKLGMVVNLLMELAYVDNLPSLLASQYFPMPDHEYLLIISGSEWIR